MISGHFRTLENDQNENCSIVHNEEACEVMNNDDYFQRTKQRVDEDVLRKVQKWWKMYVFIFRQENLVLISNCYLWNQINLRENIDHSDAFAYLILETEIRSALL